MNQKKTIIVLLVLVTAGAVGYFVWAQKSLTTPTAQQPANQQPSTNWQIYRNVKYGFEFQYPKEVTVQEMGNVIRITYETAIGGFRSGWEIDALQNNAKKDLRDWFGLMFDTKDNKDCKEIKSNIVINGAYTLLFDSESMEDACLNGGYYTISPDKLTVVHWSLGQDPQYLNEILSTFKFTK